VLAYQLHNRVTSIKCERLPPLSLQCLPPSLEGKTRHPYAHTWQHNEEASDHTTSENVVEIDYDSKYVLNGSTTRVKRASKVKGKFN
jgi:hypothetical protein